MSEEIEKIRERNKRGQGSHVQREDIALLLQEIERLQADLISSRAQERDGK